MTRILDMSSVVGSGFSHRREKNARREQTVHVVLGACVYLVPIRSQQQTDRCRRARLARLSVCHTKGVLKRTRCSSLVSCEWIRGTCKMKFSTDERHHWLRKD